VILSQHMRHRCVWCSGEDRPLGSDRN
jgi:hypothetical protein